MGRSPPPPHTPCPLTCPCVLPLQEAISAAHIKVQRLKEMLQRNSGNKQLRGQIQERLAEAVQEAEGAQVTGPDGGAGASECDSDAASLPPHPPSAPAAPSPTCWRPLPMQAEKDRMCKAVRDKEARRSWTKF